jgi:hypothetical protein
VDYEKLSGDRVGEPTDHFIDIPRGHMVVSFRLKKYLCLLFQYR